VSPKQTLPVTECSTQHLKNKTILPEITMP